MTRSDSLLSKRVDLSKQKNPLETTVECIVDIVDGVYKKPRTQPIIRQLLVEFFPYTPPELFGEALNKAIEEKKIELVHVSKARGYGYLTCGNNA